MDVFTFVFLSLLHLCSTTSESSYHLYKPAPGGFTCLWELSHSFTISPSQQPSLISKAQAWLTYSLQMYTSVCKHVHTHTVTRRQAHGPRRQGQPLSIYRLSPRLLGSGTGPGQPGRGPRIVYWISRHFSSSWKRAQRLRDMFQPNIAQKGSTYLNER